MISIIVLHVPGQVEDYRWFRFLDKLTRPADTLPCTLVPGPKLLILKRKTNKRLITKARKHLHLRT